MDVKTPATIPYFLQEQIRGLIVDGTIRPGQPLREQELEQLFGTSRSPIREALRLLELNGLVTHIQRKGFRVTLYTETQIRHLYMLRAELESYCIRQLAERDDMAPLVVELNRCQTNIVAALVDNDVRAFITAMRDFYLTAAHYTGNTPLAGMLSKLYEQLEPLRHLVARQSSEVRALQSGTHGIPGALEARDFERAAQMPRDYIAAVLPEVLQTYRDASPPEIEEPPLRFLRA